MQQQARNFALVIAKDTDHPSYLIHDRDGAFLPLYGALRTEGVKIVKTSPQSPMCNAYAERFVRENRKTLGNPILPDSAGRTAFSLRTQADSESPQ